VSAACTCDQKAGVNAACTCDQKAGVSAVCTSGVNCTTPGLASAAARHASSPEALPGIEGGIVLLQHGVCPGMVFKPPNGPCVCVCVVECLCVRGHA